MKRIFTLAVAALLFAGSAMAQDQKAGKGKKDQHGKQHDKHHGKERKDKVKDLNLSETQKQQAKAINQEYKEKSKALKKERKAKMESVLNDEQKAKIKAQKEQRKAEGKGNKHGRGDKEGRGDKMKEELGITDAQGQQIKAINEDFRAKAKAIKENQSLTQEQKKAQFQALNEQRKASMKSVLTAEQIRKMEAKQKEGKGRKERKEK